MEPVYLFSHWIDLLYWLWRFDRYTSEFAILITLHSVRIQVCQFPFREWGNGKYQYNFSLGQKRNSISVIGNKGSVKVGGNTWTSRILSH